MLAPGAVIFLAALAWSGVLAPPTFEGLPTTPLLTLILVPTLRLLMFATGAFALGAAVVGGMLIRDATLLRRGGVAAVLYAVSSAFLALVTLADVLATTPWGALRPTMLWSFITQIDEGRYLAAQVVIGFVSAWILRSEQPQVLAAVELLSISVVLPGFTGHSAAAVSHWIASATMIVHLEAVTLWVGGVAALLLTGDVNATKRFSKVALAAYFGLVLSGFASVYARTSDWSALTHGRYGLVLVAKLVLTVALGVLGYRQRQHMVANAPLQTVRATLTREAGFMAAALAFAVTLARMANP